jgi:hypothetical protein
VYGDALKTWEGGCTTSEEVAELDGVEASCELVAPLGSAVESDDEALGE